jgi:hypothetical protein
MLEKDELSEGGGRLLEVVSNVFSFKSGAYIKTKILVLEKSFWREI